MRHSLPSVMFVFTLAACTGQAGIQPGSGLVVPNFTLTDTNSLSATYEQKISVRDEMGNISGWYFGHGD